MELPCCPSKNEDFSMDFFFRSLGMLESGGKGSHGVNVGSVCQPVEEIPP